MWDSLDAEDALCLFDGNKFVLQAAIKERIEAYSGTSEEEGIIPDCGCSLSVEDDGTMRGQAIYEGGILYITAIPLDSLVIETASDFAGWLSGLGRFGVDKRGGEQ